MSHSDNQVLQVVGFDDDDDEEEEEDGGGGGVHGNHEEKKKKKQRGFDCTRNIRRAKQVVLSKLKQKPKPKQSHQSNLLSSSSSATTANAAPSGTTTKGCCFCFKKPLTLDSSVDESLCSDPNDPNFSFDMLKSLIENNDFYSKESNPHFHVSPD